jgi:hypothetical protein
MWTFRLDDGLNHHRSWDEGVLLYLVSGIGIPGILPKTATQVSRLLWERV